MGKPPPSVIVTFAPETEVEDVPYALLDPNGMLTVRPVTLPIEVASPVPPHPPVVSPISSVPPEVNRQTRMLDGDWEMFWL